MCTVEPDRFKAFSKHMIHDWMVQNDKPGIKQPRSSKAEQLQNEVDMVSYMASYLWCVLGCHHVEGMSMTQ